MLQTILLPGDDLSKHADSVHPVPLLDDAWLQDCESNGVVVMGQMNEEKSVACHLDHVQKDTYSVDDKDSVGPKAAQEQLIIIRMLTRAYANVQNTRRLNFSIKPFLASFCFFSTSFYIIKIAGIKLRLTEQKANTLTTLPPTRPSLSNLTIQVRIQLMTSTSFSDLGIVKWQN